jgi:hypothetical protein
MHSSHCLIRVFQHSRFAKALADAVAELSVPAGRQAAAGALCALAAHPGCRAVLADRGGVQAFVNLTVHPPSSPATSITRAHS